jgi:RNA polymerase sigma-32 factor
MAMKRDKKINKISKIIKDAPIEVLDSKVVNDHNPGNDIKNYEDLLPTIIPSKEFEKTSDSSKTAVSDPLTLYLREISKYKLLSKEQEQEMTKALYETGDIEIAKKLVLANLRLVVKISMEYKYAYSNVIDLIQEGNIGLMKAVSKYDPYKGAKISYYASWWIKSYILKFILDNFRLVKIGTTNDQKKLFYNLLKEKDRLVSMGITPDSKAISESLGVSEKAVKVMEQRLLAGGAELSLDKPLSDKDGSFSLGDVLADEDKLSMDEELGNLQNLDILNENLEEFLSELKPRDKEIFQKRLLSEIPQSLQSIADDYGVSRERIRQIEERLLKSLRVYMLDFFS